MWRSATKQEGSAPVSMTSLLKCDTQRLMTQLLYAYDEWRVLFPSVLSVLPVSINKLLSVRLPVSIHRSWYGCRAASDERRARANEWRCTGFWPRALTAIRRSRAVAGRYREDATTDKRCCPSPTFSTSMSSTYSTRRWHLLVDSMSSRSTIDNPETALTWLVAGRDSGWFWSSHKWSWL